MALIITKNNNDIIKYVIEGYVDTEAEIANLKTDYTPGSKITVIENGDIYILNSQYVWTKIGL